MMLILLAIAQTALTHVLDTPSERAVAEQPLVELFSYEDYPPDALRRDAQGDVRVRLRIDTHGRAQACEVVQSSKDASLDAATCGLLIERSRFRPARNAAGQAVYDFVETQLNWRIADTRTPFSANDFRLTLRRGPQEPACVIFENGETRDELLEICDLTFGPDALALADQSIIELRFEMRLTPVGEHATPVDRVGELVRSYAGELTVAPNGTRSQCATTREEVGENAALAAATYPDPCLLWTDIQFEEQQRGRDLRRATFEGVFLAVRGGET